MNIIIRSPRIADTAALYQLSNDSRVISGTAWHPYSSPDTWNRLIGQPAEGHHILVAEVDGEVVAEAELLSNRKVPRRSHSSSFAIAVRDDWQGRGIGTKLTRACLALADDWLNVLRLELVVWASNAVAISLYERHGFVREGTHRAFGIRHGIYEDAVFMSRLHPSPPSIREIPTACSSMPNVATK